MMTAVLPSAPTRIEIEFLYLDLTTCERCVGTSAQLERALARILVVSAEQARALRFLSSPTIRVNGRDVARELTESTCEAGACSCGGETACRVWRYEGREYNEAPAGLIVDAVLAALTGGDTPTPPSQPQALPANLERFFARREEPPASDPCCTPHDQAECCQPSDKADCCAEAAKTGKCGCQ
jgi:hypothetical protein